MITKKEINESHLNPAYIKELGEAIAKEGQKNAVDLTYIREKAKRIERFCIRLRQIQERAENKNLREEKFIVRLYDGFDNEWIDVSSPVSKEEAQKIWNEKTKNGTQKTKYEDIDYYAIFPADSVMHFSSQEGRKVKC